jgi:hypothetical protein
MREIRPSGSEGGVALTTPLLPLSGQCAQEQSFRHDCGTQRGSGAQHLCFHRLLPG